MMLKEIQLLNNCNFLNIIYDKNNVCIGRVKSSNIYMRVEKSLSTDAIEYIDLSWYYMDDNPSKSSKITFDVVLDTLSDEVSDEIFFNLDFFTGKRIILNKEL